jgi:hypothetical protein
VAFHVGRRRHILVVHFLIDILVNPCSERRHSGFQATNAATYKDVTIKNNYLFISFQPKILNKYLDAYPARSCGFQLRSKSLATIGRLMDCQRHSTSHNFNEHLEK